MFNALGSRSVCVSGNSCITNKSLSSQCPPGMPYIAFESAQADKVIGYTNMSSLLDLLAPSADAYTTDIAGSAGYSSNNYTSNFSGTSASSPYAAGAAAILQQSAKSLTGNFLSVSELKSILINTGNPVTDDKVNITKPRINIGNAINFLESNNNTFEGLTPNGTTTGVKPTFTWTPLAGQTEYWVLADNGSLSWPYVVYQSISATSANCGSGTCSYTSSVNFAPGTAVWQVKAPQSSGSWPETNVLSFTVGSGTSTFQGLTPNGTATGVKPTFTWTPLAGQTEYWVIADNGSSLSWPYVVYQSISATSANCGSGTCSYTSSVNFSSGTAVWHVKAPQPSGSWPETSLLNFNIN